MYFHIAGRNEGFFSHVASATWELKVVILLKSLVTMHATKGFFTRVDSFVYFHIAGKNEFFSPVWLLPWFLTVVIVLESLVTMHATKGFFTSVDCFMDFHIAGRNEGFFSCVASSIVLNGSNSS